MISQDTFEKVRHLLASGELSRSRIALLTCVSRATVRRIASGKRPGFRPDAEGGYDVADVGQDVADVGPLRRCPGCGGQVFLPCRLCRVRGMIERGRYARHEARRAAARAALVAVLRGQRSRLSA